MNDTMKNLAKILGVLAAISLGVAAICGCSSAPKTRSVDLSGMYASAATETLAIGSVEIISTPQGEESLVVKYSEDTAWLSPSTKTRSVMFALNGTNSVQQAGAIADGIAAILLAVSGDKDECCTPTQKPLNEVASED